jgi:hypothetical protein
VDRENCINALKLDYDGVINDKVNSITGVNDLPAD